MNLNDMKTRVAPTFERRKEPIEIVKTLPEEDEILVRFGLLNGSSSSNIVCKNGDVYTVKFNEGELVEDSEGEGYFENLMIRRNDLKLTQDEIKQIETESVYVFELLPDFD